MRSRLVVPRAEIALCWLNTARLQDAVGKTEEAANSRATAKRVREVAGWVNKHGHPR